MLNYTRIPAPRVTIVDPQTGIVSNEWFRFFNNLYTIAYAATGSVTPGTYGSATAVPQITVDDFGTITGITNVPIAIDASQIVSGTIASARISGSYTGITGVGTLTVGTWNATAITTPYGGTGLTSYTAGDTLYYASGSALTKLAIGASTFINTSSGTAPQWTDPSTITIGKATNLVGGAANRIAYQTAADTTGFIVAPTVSNTYLEWSGTAFQWSSNPLGTVTSVSVVSANGLAGTVATATTTPAITLSTTVTGLLKGNGTAISAASSGTDYAPATSGTSILYGNGAGGFSNVTIGTGVSFAGGTLSATGSGGTVTSVAATVPSFLSISGSPITTSGTLAITLSGTALPVTSGGTGLTTLTAGYIPYGNGTSAFASSSGFIWDSANARLGITTSAPPLKLSILSVVTTANTSTPVIMIGSDRVDRYASIDSVRGGVSSVLGLAFSTSNGAAPAEVARIHASGGVSIGNTTDPGATNLSVTGTIASASTVTGTALIPSAATIPINGMYLPAANSVGFATNSTNAIYIDSSQNVGIGTSSPLGRLDVAGTTPNLTIRNTKSGLWTDGEVVGTLSWYTNDTSGIGAHDVATIQVTNVGSQTTPNSNLAFSTAVHNVPKVERMRIDYLGNVYIQTNTLWQYAPAPTSKAAAATLTAAEVQTGILNTTGTTYTVTLPTGTALDTAFAGVPTTNIGFDWFVVNTASGTITIAVGASGMTALGTLTIATGVSAQFRLRRTAANTYVLYRLG